MSFSIKIIADMEDLVGYSRNSGINARNTIILLGLAEKTDKTEIMLERVYSRTVDVSEEFARRYFWNLNTSSESVYLSDISFLKFDINLEEKNVGNGATWSIEDKGRVRFCIVDTNEKIKEVFIFEKQKKQKLDEEKMKKIKEEEVRSKNEKMKRLEEKIAELEAKIASFEEEEEE